MHQRTPFRDVKFKKKILGGAPSPDGEGDTPSPLLTQLKNTSQASAFNSS